MPVLTKIFISIILTILVFSVVSGQNLYLVQGWITDDRMEILAGANVAITPGNQGASTDQNGYFVFWVPGDSRIILQVTYIGFETSRIPVTVRSDTTLTIRLKPGLQSLQEIIVTDDYAERREREESLNLEVVNDAYIRQNSGGSLMNSLDRLPGVGTMDIGSGQSKPVIRGLGFNRIAVVENGIRHEGQQWGSDHGLEADQFAYDRIEIIKGPASLMYGSDAIGGVINLQQSDIPAAGTAAGNLTLTGKSNNHLGGSSFFYSRRNKNLFYAFRGTWIDYGDYRIPADSIDIYSYKAALDNKRLRNTAGEEKNLHFSAGYLGARFSSRLYAGLVHMKSGFFANTHGLEPRNVNIKVHDISARDILFPYQQVSHFSMVSTSEWFGNQWESEIILGYQRNFRQEFSEYVSHGYMPAVFPEHLTFPEELERQFDKHHLSANGKTEREWDDRFKFSAGINAETQINRIDGRGFIIPGFRSYSAGAYTRLVYDISGRASVQAGIRTDLNRIITNWYSDWFLSPVIQGNDTTMSFAERAPAIKKTFPGFSWSIGYNYYQEKLHVKLNMGKSFRVPIAKELAANGVNYHHFSFEKGDPDLSPEVSYQLDAGLEWHTRKFAVEISPFVNYFSNYIYLNPGFEHDRLYGNGNQVFRYSETSVLRHGGELHSHLEITRNIQLGVILDYVHSVQLTGDKKGFTLPFSPPHSGVINLKFSKNRFYGVRDPYLSADLMGLMDQNNIVPPEKTTPGHAVIHLTTGGKVTIWNQEISLTVGIRNLLNHKYFNHSSYYRLINVPEPGRNVHINLYFPFSYQIP